MLVGPRGSSARLIEVLFRTRGLHKKLWAELCPYLSTVISSPHEVYIEHINDAARSHKKTYAFRLTY
jgi:hypothetical protein